MLKKDELIVFNKIDLVGNKELIEKKKEFKNKIKKEVLVLSTKNKKLVSEIKSKLLKYVH